MYIQPMGRTKYTEIDRGLVCILRRVLIEPLVKSMDGTANMFASCLKKWQAK